MQERERERERERAKPAAQQAPSIICIEHVRPKPLISFLSLRPCPLISYQHLMPGAHLELKLM